MRGGPLESRLVQIHFNGQQPSFLVVIRRANSDSNDGAQGIGRGTVQVVEVFFVSVDAQRLERKSTMSMGAARYPHLQSSRPYTAPAPSAEMSQER